MPNYLNRQALVYRWPLVIYAIAIFAQSCFPSPEVLQDLDFSDKFLHFGGYALLGALMVRMLKRELPGQRPWKIIVLAVVLSTFYGVSDELHQALVPGRYADVMDIVADLTGSILGAILFWWDLPILDRPITN
ncbi:MAG: VanZ family protein [Desulfobacterium sp.]